MTETQVKRARVRDTLRELEAELRAARGVDSEQRERLERAIAALEAALDRSGADEADAGEEHGVVDHLGDAMRRFEASHPKLSVALGRVVDALSNLGI